MVADGLVGDQPIEPFGILHVRDLEHAAKIAIVTGSSIANASVVGQSVPIAGADAEALGDHRVHDRVGAGSDALQADVTPGSAHWRIRSRGVHLQARVGELVLHLRAVLLRHRDRGHRVLTLGSATACSHTAVRLTLTGEVVMTLRARAHARTKPLCVKDGSWARRSSAAAAGVGSSSGSGVTFPKSRPQGAEPVTLDSSRPVCPPGPAASAAAGIGEELAVDGVADATL